MCFNNASFLNSEPRSVTNMKSEKSFTKLLGADEAEDKTVFSGNKIFTLFTHTIDVLICQLPVSCLC